MKKLIVGLTAVGAVLVLRSAAGRGGQKMREHCKEAAAQFKRHGRRAETSEHSEQEAPKLAEVSGEAVGTV